MLRALCGRAQVVDGKRSPGPDCRTFSRLWAVAALAVQEGDGGWGRPSRGGWRGAPAVSACSPSARTAIGATSTAGRLAPRAPAATACAGRGGGIAAAPKVASTIATGSARAADAGVPRPAWGITLPRPRSQGSSCRRLATRPGSPPRGLPPTGSRRWRSSMPLVLFPSFHPPAYCGPCAAGSAAVPAAGFAPPPPRIAGADARPQAPEPGVAS